MKHRYLSGLLAAAALWAAPLAAQVVAYHDASSATHQAQFNNLSANGYRLITLSIYGTHTNLQYAAVWVQRAGPNQICFHDATSAQYQAILQQNMATHSPRILTACGSGNNARFAGVLEAVNHPVYARHDLTTQGLSAELLLAEEDNEWRVATIDAYGTAQDPRYIVAFEPQDDNLGWGLYTATSVLDHQAKAEAMLLGHCRPVHVAFNDDSSAFATLWHDTQVSGGCIFEHDLTAAEYQQRTTDYNNQYNFYPINVQGSGSGNGRRFAAVWAANDLPQGRQWSTSGQHVPALAAYDGWMQNWMQSTGTRGASLAIVKDGKLVFARGYNWAESGYPQTLPTSRFRIASCTKPLTSIAIHQEIQQAPQFINYGSQMVDFFNNPPVQDLETNLITVKDLLMHQGGWDRDPDTGSGIDPMFNDSVISAAQGDTIPISITSIRNWMEGRNLDYSPGDEYRYSNYGYALLGRILERRNQGQTYTQVMQNQVFGPLGITRAVIGGATLDEILDDEVRYHPQRLRVARSVNSVDMPLVPIQYGGWNQRNMDSHGAYIMATVDFAKVLASFDFALSNPLLGDQQTENMWTPNPNDPDDEEWLRGWFRTWVPNGQGDFIRMFDHGGALPGTRTYIAHRPDGISFVLFGNGDVDIGGTQGRQLSDIANGISMWPPHDLFGSVGLPGFTHIDDVMSPYGSGCPGTGGTPYANCTGSADLGGRLSMNIVAAPAGAPLLCVLGFVPTAVDLGFLGAPGCSLLTDPALTWFTFASATGNGTQTADVPADLALIGQHVYVQYGIGDARVNSFGLTTSNGVDVTIGGWISR